MSKYDKTYCNPTPLPDYPIGRLCYKDDFVRREDFRESADPSVIFDNGVWYLYPSCGMVYWSDDFIHWNHEHMEPYDIGYAPTVVKHKGRYLLCAMSSELYVSDSPLGPFVPHSKGALTPSDWECLDGTLYIDEEGVPYLVFCHEHTQIIDGTICYVRLNEELNSLVGEAVTMFSASSYELVDPQPNGHYITDGPFMYRSKSRPSFLFLNLTANCE